MAAAVSEQDRSTMIAARDAAAALHAPVLLAEVVAGLAPAKGGAVIDGTFGAGGYSRALLEAGAAEVIALDRDPEAIARGAAWSGLYDGRLTLAEARFSSLDAHAPAGGAAGVALDLGVSSMQIDAAARGFSFQKDGPLDMRMDQDGDGESAADLVRSLSEEALADILYYYGEEKAARRIARAIVAARDEAPIETTARLAEIVSRRLPRPKPGQPHPATRSFQGLRIAVNEELDELAAALSAAERALAPGGVLAVVSFHSLEDRVVKRFLQDRSGAAPQGSRYQPPINPLPATFTLVKRGSIAPSAEEIAANPRSRSAKLRLAARTEAPARADPVDLGLGRAFGAKRGAQRRRVER